LIVAAVVLLGAGGYLLLRGNGSSTPKASPIATSQPGQPSSITAQAPPVSAKLPTMSPRTFLHRSIVLARHSVGFTATLQASLGSVPFSGESASGQRTGAQVVQIGSQVAAERVFPGVTYVDGTSAVLHALSHFPSAIADAAAGQWVALRPGDKPYRDTTNGVTVGSFWSGMGVHGRLRYLEPAVHNGVEAVGVNGYTGHGKTRKTVTAWIAASGRPYPVELTVSGMSKSGPETMDTLVSNWGQQPHVVRPAHAVSYRSLGAGGA
jgi:hypothetical protein